MTFSPSLPLGKHLPLVGSVFRVHITTKGRIVEVLQPKLVRTGKKGGQPKLSVEDHLLVTFLLLAQSRRCSASGEYRTYFHTGKSAI